MPWRSRVSTVASAVDMVRVAGPFSASFREAIAPPVDVMYELPSCFETHVNSLRNNQRVSLKITRQLRCCARGGDTTREFAHASATAPVIYRCKASAHPLSDRSRA